MTRIAIPSPEETARSSLQPLFHFVSKRFGFIPDIYRILSVSPQALVGFTEMQAALARTLDVRTRERIALAVSEINGCRYCVSAHSYLGHHFAKLVPEEIALNRLGRSFDPKAEAAVRFAREVAMQRGRVEPEDLATVREAGYSDAQIIEIVALVAQFLLTILLANVFDVKPDFPNVQSAEFTQRSDLTHAKGDV
ncbi:putative peroxidase-related enzyme [Paraburkholderia sp. BL8N3]|nr:carboxymuconolactone decarboxylase family protein [Paraburkholderia sp. BL8N3]TCK33281.1 putative peroxidase-related enzyme [Paraburkholderia sp. BL8N3]